ncbi:MAG: hypothetical protein CVU57_01595 [Deltaproteobacteria bacterium HGW-Deltaproteobacteria-15]|jgi:hypothetical protein|nr:MAG: hypothetical protein CVU57_01595 [Deltaproteobacteria bacterium HGW-Deltaproteobacteria-15]
MEMQQQKVRSQSDDDVLDFDLDDISLEDIDQRASGDEEEVIELTDLVARGMPVETAGDQSDVKEDEIVELLKEDQVQEEEGEFKLLADDLAGIDFAEKETAENDVADFALELDLKEEEQKSGEEKPDEESLSSADFDDILNEEEPVELVSEASGAEGKDLEEIVSLEEMDSAPERSEPDQADGVLSEDLLKDEAVSETGAEPSPAGMSEDKDLEEIASVKDLDEAQEKSAPDQPDMFSEDLLKNEAPTVVIPRAAAESLTSEDKDLDGPPEKSTPERVDVFSEDLLEEEAPSPGPEAAAGPVAIGISEEKLEAIVTRVVQDVVERVARETMTSVAEKVIGEAIESLKKSLSENP